MTDCNTGTKFHFIVPQGRFVSNKAEAGNAPFVTINFPTIKERVCEWLNEQVKRGDLDGFLRDVGGCMLEERTSPVRQQEALDIDQLLRSQDWKGMLRSIDGAPLQTLNDRDRGKANDLLGKLERGMVFNDSMKTLCAVLFKKAHRIGDFDEYPYGWYPGKDRGY